jgi:hypothetical protein
MPTQMTERGSVGRHTDYVSSGPAWPLIVVAIVATVIFALTLVHHRVAVPKYINSHIEGTGPNNGSVPARR